MVRLNKLYAPKHAILMKSCGHASMFHMPTKKRANIFIVKKLIAIDLKLLAGR
jgi:hypothetical protein